MEFRTGSINFGAAHGFGPRSESTDIQFNKNVKTAVALLTGMDFGYSCCNDHHLGVVDIKVIRILWVILYE